jgi:hypothetical protein
MSADATCALCGRTILAGERVHGYPELDHERTVCELCVGRAEKLGWRADGEADPEPSPLDSHHRRGRLRGLLRRPSRRPGSPSSSPAQPQSTELADTDPAAAPRARRRPAPVLDLAAPTPFQRAVVRFNSSEAARTVTGLTRTLGRPWVSVGASAGAPEEVRITVAWELSWYQWGVDIGDELRPVFEIAKGREIGQLDAASKQWNASVAGEGRLSLGVPEQRSASGEPTPS